MTIDGGTMGNELHDVLVTGLRMSRDAERDVFDELDPTVRDRPLREGDWSPKDHQAHLTAWKARQANRFAAANRGEEPEQTAEGETDAINAELHAARANWTWDAITQEADEVSERLIREISATDQDLLVRRGRLIGGTFGNGAFHALEHFRWLLEADVGVNAARVASFVDELSELVSRGGLPDADAGAGMYNIACHYALSGRLDAARPLLRKAFRLSPDLATFALEDTDLTALRGELEALAAPAAG
jgi:hypothetical protein